MMNVDKNNKYNPLDEKELNVDKNKKCNPPDETELLKKQQTDWILYVQRVVALIILCIAVFLFVLCFTTFIKKDKTIPCKHNRCEGLVTKIIKTDDDDEIYILQFDVFKNQKLKYEGYQIIVNSNSSYEENKLYKLYQTCTIDGNHDSKFSLHKTKTPVGRHEKALFFTFMGASLLLMVALSIMTDDCYDVLQYTWCKLSHKG